MANSSSVRDREIMVKIAKDLHDYEEQRMKNPYYRAEKERDEPYGTESQDFHRKSYQSSLFRERFLAICFILCNCICSPYGMLDILLGVLR